MQVNEVGFDEMVRERKGKSIYVLLSLLGRFFQETLKETVRKKRSGKRGSKIVACRVQHITLGLLFIFQYISNSSKKYDF